MRLFRDAGCARKSRVPSAVAPRAPTPIRNRSRREERSDSTMAEKSRRRPNAFVAENDRAAFWNAQENFINRPGALRTCQRRGIGLSKLHAHDALHTVLILCNTKSRPPAHSPEAHGHADGPLHDRTPLPVALVDVRFAGLYVRH